MYSYYKKRNRLSAGFIYAVYMLLFFLYKYHYRVYTFHEC